MNHMPNSTKLCKFSNFRFYSIFEATSSTTFQPFFSPIIGFVLGGVTDAISEVEHGIYFRVPRLHHLLACVGLPVL